MEKNDFLKTKKILIVVDMVNGFVREGAMASKNVEKIIPEIEELVKNFKGGEETTVAFIKDTHEMTAREFKRYPVHCVKRTSESELVSELKDYEEGSLVYEKNSTSAIFPGELISDIDKMTNLEKIVIVGCCTDICVMNLVIPLQCYLDECDRDIEIVVPKNAVETYDAPVHKADEWNEMAFKFMEQSGIKLVKKYGGK